MSDYFNENELNEIKESAEAVSEEAEKVPDEAISAAGEALDAVKEEIAAEAAADSVEEKIAQASEEVKEEIAGIKEEVADVKEAASDPGQELDAARAEFEAAREKYRAARQKASEAAAPGGERPPYADYYDRQKAGAQQFAGEHSYSFRQSAQGAPTRPAGYGAPAQGAQQFARHQGFVAPGYGAPQYGAPGQFGAAPGYGAPQGYAAPGFAPSQRTAAAQTAQSDGAKTKKKKSGGVKRTLLSILAALLVVAIGAGSGILGTLVYDKLTGKEDSTAVMYKAVETSSSKANASGATVAEVANTVSDSVVEITTEFVTTGYFSFGQYVTKGAGSGVIISDDGYIITNNHVISDTDNGGVLADKIAVRLRTGDEYAAKLVGRDADADIAVIKIEAEGLSAAVWGDSESLTVGDQVVVVGNPLGELGGTVTTGIVSAQDREIKIDETKMNLIQTDAAVNPGNSGGGMFNMKGELIGIVNAKSSGTGIEGLGFAIPESDARDVAEQLLEFGYVKGKVYLGITFYEANSGWFSSDSSGILYVYSCEKGYNDDVLQYGDQMISVEGTAVSTKADVKAIISEHEVGDTVTFTIIRNRRTMDVEVTIYEYQPTEDVSFEN